MSVDMTLGGYIFDPVPVMSISDEILRTEGGIAFGKATRITLNGQLLSFGEGAGCAPTFGQIIEKQQELRDSITCSGCYPFLITCQPAGGPQTTIISTDVRVRNVNINESDDNWVLTAPYTIELEYNISSGTGCYDCLTSIGDDWSLEPLETKGYVGINGCDYSSVRFYRVSRTLSAAGVECCFENVIKPGWETAKEWVISQLSGSPPDIQDGVIDIPNIASLVTGDHVRIIRSNVTNGTYELEESWTAILSGAPSGCTHEFTIEEQSSIASRYNTYIINGTIIGMESRQPDYTLISTKLQSAEACWSQIYPDLTGEIGCHYDIVGCPLNAVPKSSSVGKNPLAGTITYNYEYDQRPISLFSGALSESIQINDNLPALIIGETPILGRTAGPYLYSTNTTTSTRKSVSISVVLPQDPTCGSGVTDCDRFSGMDAYVQTYEPNVNNILCCIETQLNNQYDKVYKTDDRRSYDPIAGTYQRDMAWIYQKCETPILDACGLLPE